MNFTRHYTIKLSYSFQTLSYGKYRNNQFLGKVKNKLADNKNFELLKSRIKSEKLQSDKDDIIDDDVIDLHSELPRLYQDYLKEKKDHQKFIKKKTIEHKYFKKPQEVCLLTWSAKEQLRYLHRSNPKEWTPERLSESFPVSIEGVKKLLRSSFVPESLENIIQHDERVKNNWKSVAGENSGPVVNYYQKLLEMNKLPSNLLNSKTKTFTLPNSYVSQNSLIPSPVKSKIGPYSKMIQSYVQIKKKDKTEISLLKAKIDKSSFLINAVEDNKDNKCITDEFNAKGHWIQYSHFQKQLMNEGLGTDNVEMENEFKKWLGKKIEYQQSSQTEAFEKKMKENEECANEDFVVKKLKSVENPAFINLKVDSSQRIKNENIQECYMYDDKIGYQYPLGKHDPDFDNIKIPKKYWKQGAIYKKGNCFYDDKGLFLYKVI